MPKKGEAHYSAWWNEQKELTDLRDELNRMRWEVGRLTELWPQFVEGSSGTDGVVDYTDGEWWVSLGDRVGGFATKEEAIWHYLTYQQEPS